MRRPGTTIRTPTLDGTTDASVSPSAGVAPRGVRIDVNELSRRVDELNIARPAWVNRRSHADDAHIELAELLVHARQIGVDQRGQCRQLLVGLTGQLVVHGI